MTDSARRLIWFVAGVLMVLGALEWLVRSNASLFAAASHRALVKVAMFEKHPKVEVLFLGTSRTQDGVSPDLMTRALADIAPQLGAVPGYNAAFTGAGLNALIALAPRFGYRSDVKTVVVELSGPQCSNETTDWEEAKTTNLTLEDRLGEVAQHVAFVRHRKAFVSDNLIRLPTLLVFGPSLGGWETHTSEQLATWLGHKEAAATNFDATKWMPKVLTGDAEPIALKPDFESVAARLTTLAKEFQDHHIQVVFAVPPMSRKLVRVPERDSMLPLFTEIARRTQCEVWNFASLSLPDHLFRDPSHLGTEGRAHYSRALAMQLARVSVPHP